MTDPTYTALLDGGPFAGSRTVTLQCRRGTRWTAPVHLAVPHPAGGYACYEATVALTVAAKFFRDHPAQLAVPYRYAGHGKQLLDNTTVLPVYSAHTAPEVVSGL